MKLKTIVTYRQLLQRLKDTRLEDFSYALDLYRAIDKAEKELNGFDKVQLQAAEKYGTATDKPGQYEISEPEKFTQEVEKLLDKQIDITFPVTKQDTFKGMDISPAEVSGLFELKILYNGKAAD